MKQQASVNKQKLLKDLVGLRRNCKRHYKEIGCNNDFSNGIRSAVSDEIADIDLLINSIKRGEYDN